MLLERELIYLGKGTKESIIGKNNYCMDLIFRHKGANKGVHRSVAQHGHFHSFAREKTLTQGMPRLLIDVLRIQRVTLFISLIKLYNNIPIMIHKYSNISHTNENGYILENLMEIFKRKF